MSQMIDIEKCSFLEETGLVTAFFTYKTASVWKNQGDLAIKTMENYQNLSIQLGISPEKIVRSDQTHTSRVKLITKENAGEGVTRPLSDSDYDGMITNEPGLLLATVEADCVPVYLLDPVKKAIGMVHSGWRGTAGKISVNAVKMMSEAFGSHPQDILAYTGPCICADCYEVSEDLLPPFAENYSSEQMAAFFKEKGGGKYLLNLPLAIKISLTEAGLMPENICHSGLCTLHDDRFCSYRRDHDPLQRMLTAIILK